MYYFSYSFSDFSHTTIFIDEQSRIPKFFKNEVPNSENPKLVHVISLFETVKLSVSTTKKSLKSIIKHKEISFVLVYIKDQPSRTEPQTLYGFTQSKT